MMAHKFLASGGHGPFSGFAWPLPAGGAPGAWVSAEGPLEPCARGVHVCRAIDLAHWIHDELWEVETSGESIVGADCLIVRGARLVRRIDAWADGRHRFAQASIDHAVAEIGAGAAGPVRELLEDARQMAGYGYPSLAAYTAAVAVGRARGGDPASTFRDERAWQSAWIARHAAGADTD